MQSSTRRPTTRAEIVPLSPADIAEILRAAESKGVW